jgi:hypothetical protein
MQVQAERTFSVTGVGPFGPFSVRVVIVSRQPEPPQKPQLTLPQP